MRAQDKMEELLTILFTIGVRPHSPLTPPSPLERQIDREVGRFLFLSCSDPLPASHDPTWPALSRRRSIGLYGLQ